MTVGVQVFEQCSGHIGEAAGLGERGHFGRRKTDFQWHCRILPQCETAVGEAIIMGVMRSLAAWMRVV